MDHAPLSSAETAASELVHEIDMSLDGMPARVFLGGDGPPLLLVHGGWGGARTHWSAVWTRLAERFYVIAPDLPGIGCTDRSGLGSLGAYSRWLDSLLDALEVEAAWCVGNSFGASVVSRFALDFPERCLGLVMVDGSPMPVTPPFLKRLGHDRLASRIVKAVQRRIVYTPRAVARGFYDLANVPEETRALVREKSPAILDAFAPILIEGGVRERPPFAPLFVWGAEDRTLGARADRSPQRLIAKWPGAELALVPRAGHLPQVENPKAFVDMLERFVEERAAA